jgi:hypothetical protein
MIDKNDSNSPQRTVQIGQVVEIDTALPLTVSKTVQIGQGLEVDTVLPLSVLSTINLPHST